MPSSASPLPRGSLYLIDTMGYVFRAFHALPPLSNARGLPTQAVLGVINMLRKLLQEAEPAALAAAYDLAGPTFRDERFAEYKATRAAMPETLSPQLPYIRRALEAFRVPILEYAGYEADDVIGTVARCAAAAGQDVVIVSSDKDLLQLVGERVWVYNPGQNLLLDAAAVEAKLGVKPGQVADLLALRGDSVDNIPGAPGIGEKGAQQLIARFGSVEQALAHAAEVERKTYRESLQNFREQIVLSKELATIHTEVPLPFTPDAWRRREPDVEACRTLYTELDFFHLLQTLPHAAPVTEAAPAPRTAERWDAAAFDRFLDAGKDLPVALVLNEDAGVAAVARGDEAGVVDQQNWRRLASALGDDARRWQWHDSKAMLTALPRVALPPPLLRAERIEDVTLLAFLDDPTQTSYSHEAVARRLGLQPDPSDTAQAARIVAAAASELHRRAEASGQWTAYRELDLPLIPVLAAMEAAGVKLDPAPLRELSLQLDRRCAACQEEVFALAGERFNLNSPQQLSEVLFTKLGLPPPARRGKTKAFSTAQDVLEELAAYPVVKPILEYRQLAKLKSTYVDALPPLINSATGRVHTTYTLAGSATGRIASSNPNLQNIPIRTAIGRQIRAAFVPEPGYRLLSADYSQIELRLLAHLSQDPLLLAAYRAGEDIHQRTASEVFGVTAEAITTEHRRRAKAVNFGIVYGLSAFGLARQLSIPQAEAAEFIKRYFERYAGVKAFIQRTLVEARREGRVRTIFGRTRPIPNLDSRNPTLRGFAERTAVNTPLQGSAADLLKLAMIRLHARLGMLGARLLLQVHDELVFEVPEPKVISLGAMVRQEMEGVAELAVPLRVEVGSGPNWRDLEE